MQQVIGVGEADLAIGSMNGHTSVTEWRMFKYVPKRKKIEFIFVLITLSWGFSVQLSDKIVGGVNYACYEEAGRH